VSELPPDTGSGVPTIETARSAAAFTAVEANAVLFAVVGSAVADVTVAVLLIVPVAVVADWIVIVALAPLASVPRLHVAFGVVHEPCVVDAERKERPPGIGSLTETLVATRGPLFVTSRLYVST
jgi:hypothetical protein